MGVAREGNKRINLSCLPCRSRKIKCDRNVPNCASCVRRGIVHQCRWGDERDNLTPRTGQPLAGDQVEGVISEVMRRIKEAPEKSPANEAKERKNQALDTVSAGTLYPCMIPKDQPGSPTWYKHIQALPSRDECFRITRYYLDNIEPVINAANADQLLDDFDCFFRHDPLIPSHENWNLACMWGIASLLFSLLQVTDDCTREDCPESTPYHDAAMYFLLNSDHLLEPTLWTLQTMILLRERLLHKAPLRAVMMWHTVTVRLAQSMGLHALGSTLQDLQRANTDNAQSRPSSPRPASTYSLMDTLQRVREGFLWGDHFLYGKFALREIARKVWANLLIFDWTAAIHADHTYVISEMSAFTAPPASLDDKEVLLLDHSDPAVLLSLHDPKRPSEASFTRAMIAFARGTRRQLDLENENKMVHGIHRLERHKITFVDREYRAIVDALPDFFKVDGQTEHRPDIVKLHRERPYLTIQRIVLFQQGNYRIMGLHYPYLIQGLRNEELRGHTDTCIQAARAIVQSFKEMHAINNAHQQTFVLFSQLLLSVVVLHFVIHFGNDVVMRDALLDDVYFGVSRLRAVSSQRGISHSAEFRELMKEIEQIYGSEAGAATTNVVTTESASERAETDTLSWLDSLTSADSYLDFGAFDRLISAHAFAPVE